MTTPWLVLLAGLPRTGKSTVAEYLASAHGFTRVCSDEVRDDYRINPWSGDPRENLVHMATHLRSLEPLLMGENVVVDSTAMFVGQRRVLFDTHIFNPASGALPALTVRRALVLLEASDEVIEQRYRDIGRRLENRAFYRERFHPVTEMPGVTVLRYRNDCAADLESIKQQMPRHLGLSFQPG